MITRKSLFAKAIALSLLAFPQISMAQEFTSADVLEWNEESQNSLFLTSVGMIGIVATQTKRHGQIVECLNEWYWIDGEVDAERNDEIRKFMQLFPEIHPQAIILAVIEKECGSFALD